MFVKFVLVLYLLNSEGAFSHALLVDRETCEDPHKELLKHKVVIQDGVELDRFFYKGYMSFGHSCVGPIGHLKPITGTK